ncbi:hypothetical protein HHL22_13840 [Hymenobacter sp. RP-2-7]|uniref:Coproporphyrinogen III oxidase n=1 Tax=Hymenobacter polaris TaxID=2682546 RepID=A0A7Y0AFR7_9BACT|nr:hypothetical protein [Hymenobacter polaris]NML66290.1 hypothetical protein [Hymenobacter polaris]
MRKTTWYLAPALLFVSAALLSSCSNSATTDTTTTTPTSTLGTDSAADKVGGTMMADSASKMSAPGNTLAADSTKKM